MGKVLVLCAVIRMRILGIIFLVSAKVLLWRVKRFFFYYSSILLNHLRLMNPSHDDLYFDKILRRLGFGKGANHAHRADQSDQYRKVLFKFRGYWWYRNSGNLLPSPSIFVRHQYSRGWRKLKPSYSFDTLIHTRKLHIQRLETCAKSAFRLQKSKGKETR